MHPVKRLRKRLGVSRSRLARDLEIPATTIQRIEELGVATCDSAAPLIEWSDGAITILDFCRPETRDAILAKRRRESRRQRRRSGSEAASA